MADGQKLYGQVTLDGHKDYDFLGTDANGVIVEGTVDLSGYLMLDQTTPQTTVGTFTFPELVVTGQATIRGAIIEHSETVGAGSSIGCLGCTYSS